MGEVAADSHSTHGVSRSSLGLNLFQGFACPQESREASLNWRRVLVLRRAAGVILAGAFWSSVFNDSARSGREASDAVSSICPWGQVDQSAQVRWTPEVRHDLEWWLDRARLEHGISLDQVSPQLDLWSDASDVGWGAHLGEDDTSGLWSQEELEMSINTRELLAIERALLFFAPQIMCNTIAVFVDNSTAIAYLRNRGHEISAAQFHRAADSPMGRVSSGDSDAAIHYGSPQWLGGLSIPTQSDLGIGVDTQDRSVSRVAEAVAGGHRPVCHLTQSPMLPIFFSVPRSERSGHRCSAPELEWVACVCLSSLVAHSSGPQEAPVVIWNPPDHHSSVLASETVVSGPSGSGCGRSGGSSSVARSSATTPLPSSSGSVRAVASCLETIQRFARSQGFSKRVAKQSALAHRPSSRMGYEAKWSIYRQWCHSEGHSVSRPSLSKIADFLFWLRRSKKLSVSAVLGYRSMLSSVFLSVLPEISTSLVI